MKKIIFILILFVCSFNVFSQVDSVSFGEITPYLGVSFSTSTGDNFKTNSYAGAEAGIGIENLMFGVAVGRGNLDFSSSDNIQNYWYELKGYVSQPIGSVRGFAVAGWGQYFDTGHSFIEYGLGAAYSVGKFDIALTVSNWDKVVYVTPGICYNFSSIKIKKQK